MLHQAGGDVEANEFREQGSRVVRLRPAGHLRDVANDLHGRHDDAPWKSPPTQYSGKGDGAELSFGGAPLAGKRGV